MRDAVRAGEPGQVGSAWADLLVCGGWQVRRLGEWLAHRSGVLCVPKTSSTSCDQAIFVDQTTDTSLFSGAVLAEIDWLG